MGKPIYKAMVSPDIEVNDYIPDNADFFDFRLDVMVGESDSDGMEVFSFRVVTPKWLEMYLENEPLIFARNFIVITRYDVAKLESCMKELISSISSENWDDFGKKFGRYGKWEFEDYQED